MCVIFANKYQKSLWTHNFGHKSIFSYLIWQKTLFRSVSNPGGVIIFWSCIGLFVVQILQYRSSACFFLKVFWCLRICEFKRIYHVPALKISDRRVVWGCKIPESRIIYLFYDDCCQLQKFIMIFCIKKKAFQETIACILYYLFILNIVNIIHTNKAEDEKQAVDKNYNVFLREEMLGRMSSLHQHSTHWIFLQADQEYRVSQQVCNKGRLSKTIKDYQRLSKKTIKDYGRLQKTT